MIYHKNRMIGTQNNLFQHDRELVHERISISYYIPAYIKIYLIATSVGGYYINNIKSVLSI